MALNVSFDHIKMRKKEIHISLSPRYTIKCLSLGAITLNSSSHILTVMVKEYVFVIFMTF